MRFHRHSRADPQRRIALAAHPADSEYPRHGAGVPVTPGQADLFLGAVRGAPFQSGRVQHTPFPGTLQLDMGPVDTVRASRRLLEETPLPEGGWQSEHAITLVNHLSSPVQIQVRERPETPRGWSLVRSSIPCAVTTSALNFDLTLAPHATQTITYRLRLVARRP